MKGDDLVKVTLTDLATGRGAMTTCSPDQVDAVKEKMFKNYFHISEPTKKRKSK